MADDTLEAELFDSSPERNKTQLNISLAATISFCIVFLFLSMSFGKVFPDENSVDSAYDWWDVPLNERHKMDLPMDTMRAQLPEEANTQFNLTRNISSPSISHHQSKTLDIQTKQKCTSLCGCLRLKKVPKCLSS
jgi:hypothetical protein